MSEQTQALSAEVSSNEEQDMFPNWRQNASQWKSRYTTTDMQAEFFLLKFNKDNIAREDVISLLKQFKEVDSVGNGELEEKDSLKLLALRGFVMGLQGMRSLVKGVDMEQNRRLSFLEWACVIFKKEWRALHADANNKEEMAKLEALRNQAAAALDKAQRDAEDKAMAAARAKALIEAASQGLSAFETENLASKAEAEAKIASKKAFDERIEAQEKEEAAAKIREEENRKAALAQSGARGMAAKYNYIDKDGRDQSMSNEARLKADAASRREKKRLEEEAKKAAEELRKKEEIARKLAEEKAKAEAEEARILEEKAKAEEEARKAIEEAKRIEEEKEMARSGITMEQRRAYAEEKKRAEEEAKRQADEKAAKSEAARQKMLARVSMFGAAGKPTENQIFTSPSGGGHQRSVSRSRAAPSPRGSYSGEGGPLSPTAAAAGPDGMPLSEGNPLSPSSDASHRFTSSPHLHTHSQSYNAAMMAGLQAQAQAADQQQGQPVVQGRYVKGQYFVTLASPTTQTKIKSPVSSPSHEAGAGAPPHHPHAHAHTRYHAHTPGAGPHGPRSQSVFALSPRSQQQQQQQAHGEASTTENYVPTAVRLELKQAAEQAKTTPPPINRTPGSFIKNMKGQLAASPAPATPTSAASPPPTAPGASKALAGRFDEIIANQVNSPPPTSSSHAPPRLHTRSESVRDFAHRFVADAEATQAGLPTSPTREVSPPGGQSHVRAFAGKFDDLITQQSAEIASQQSPPGKRSPTSGPTAAPASPTELTPTINAATSADPPASEAPLRPVDSTPVNEVVAAVAASVPPSETPVPAAATGVIVNTDVNTSSPAFPTAAATSPTAVAISPTSPTSMPTMIVDPTTGMVVPVADPLAT